MGGTCYCINILQCKSDSKQATKALKQKHKQTMLIEKAKNIAKKTHASTFDERLRIAGRNIDKLSLKHILCNSSRGGGNPNRTSTTESFRGANGSLGKFVHPPRKRQTIQLRHRRLTYLHQAWYFCRASRDCLHVFWITYRDRRKGTPTGSLDSGNKPSNLRKGS